MSQPFVLYDKDGNEITLHSPAWAAEQVEKGLLFESPPTPVVEKKAPARRRTRKQ